MAALLSVHGVKDVLSNPYVLPFGSVEVLQTFYVKLVHEGRTGFGEITPLPGYSDETAESVSACLEQVSLWAGQDKPLAQVIRKVAETAPFVASGLACALETCHSKSDAFGPIDRPVSVIGLCQGGTPEAAAEAAEMLIAEGYDALKVKVGGRPVGEDIAILQAIHDAGDHKAHIRLDANKMMSVADAHTLCDAIAERFPRVEYLEQPLAKDAWDAHRALMSNTSVPIILDESINSIADVDRAAEIGASGVKLKLCKLPGMEATRVCIEHAKSLNLSVVFGNGVQTALGNHLEAGLWQECGLSLASESVGFAKIKQARLGHQLKIVAGQLWSGGIDINSQIFDSPMLQTTVCIQ